MDLLGRDGYRGEGSHRAGPSLGVEALIDYAPSLSLLAIGLDWGSPSVWLYLLVLSIGVYVQTVTGFAMGLIVMGAATYLRVAPIAVTAAVLSLLAFVNTSLALRQKTHDIHWPYVLSIFASQIPMMGIGLWALYALSQESVSSLRFLLGLVIFLAGMALARKPDPAQKTASLKIASMAGALGGLFGGLFSTSGAPLAFFFYRQPLKLAVIRSSLLTIFTVSAMARTVMVGIQGGLSENVWTLFALGLPAVLIWTWVGRRFPPPLSEVAIKRMAFFLLAFLGISLMAQNLVPLG